MFVFIGTDLGSDALDDHRRGDTQLHPTQELSHLEVRAVLPGGLQIELDELSLARSAASLAASANAAGAANEGAMASYGDSNFWNQ